MEEFRAEQRRIINNSPIQSRRDDFITDWFKTVTEITILQWIININ
jgi:hypothetical protein